MAKKIRPAPVLPSPPASYDPRDQAELRRLVMESLGSAASDTIGLVCQAKITATTATTVTVRVGVADPEPQGKDSVTLTFAYTVASGAGTMDKTSPQLLTPESTLTYAAGTYVDIVLDRPPAHTGSGRIVFTATAPNRVAGTTSVDVSDLDIVYVQCRAKVTASDDLTVTVTVTAEAVGGTPTVGYVGVTGATLNSGHAAGTYTYAQNSTDNVWVFNRPAAGAGMGQAQFRAVLTGAQSDDDFATVIEQVPPAGIVQCSANITALDTDTVTVTVEAQSTSGTPTVGLVGVSGSATLNSGHAAGTYTYAVNGTDNVWVFNRGDVGDDIGNAQFRAIYDEGPEADDDWVPINEKGRDTLPLKVRARQIAMSATTVTVRVSVADPYPQGPDSATITYYEYNVGAPTTPASGQAVTPSDTLNQFGPLTAEDSTQRTSEDGIDRSTEIYTESPPTYVDFTITRPPFGTGAGRVVFTVAADNRTEDSDPVDVPEVNRDTVYLTCEAKVIDQDDETLTVRVGVSDPICATDPQTATITYASSGVGTITPASGQLVTPGVDMDYAAGTYCDFVIAKAEAGSGTGRVIFTATATNRVPDSDPVSVNAQDIAGLLVSIEQTASTGFSDPGAGVLPTVTLEVTITDPRGVLTGNALVTHTHNGISKLEFWNGASWDTVTSGYPGNRTLGATNVYRVTLFKALGGGGFVKFAATKTGGYEGHATFWASSAWADMNADLIITIGNNEDATDLTAKASLVVNTVANADSMKWMASTTSQPSKATVIASGTPESVGPPFYVADLGVSLNLGDTVYVTVVLYDYTGTLMDKSFEGKATRTNLSKTKTAQWAAAGNFHPYSIESKVPDGTIVRLTNEVVLDRSLDELAVNWVGPGAGLTLSVAENGRANHSFILPDGCTVTDFNAEVWDDTDTDSTVVCNVYVKCADLGDAIGDASLIAELDGTQTGGWQTLAVTGLDQDTTNKRFVAYCIMGHARNALKNTSDLYTKFRSFSVTYLPDNLQATI